jgi:hypothetical protein
MMLVKGNVVHAHQESNGLFRVGVRLTDVIEGNWDVLKKEPAARAPESPQ